MSETYKQEPPKPVFKFYAQSIQHIQNQIMQGIVEIETQQLKGKATILPATCYTK